MEPQCQKQSYYMLLNHPLSALLDKYFVVCTLFKNLQHLSFLSNINKLGLYFIGKIREKGTFPSLPAVPQLCATVLCGLPFFPLQRQLIMFLPKGSNFSWFKDFVLSIIILLSYIITFYFSTGSVPTARKHSVFIFQLTKYILSLPQLLLVKQLFFPSPLEQKSSKLVRAFPLDSRANPVKLQSQPSNTSESPMISSLLNLMTKFQSLF